MKLDQLLNESFNKAYPLGTPQKMGNMITYPFTTEAGAKYNAEFFRVNDEFGNSVYEASFSLEQGGEAIYGKQADGPKQMRTGNPTTIIATVMMAMYQMTRTYRVDAIFFDGATPALGKLYERMMNTLNVPGWHVHQFAMGSQKLFVLMSDAAHRQGNDGDILRTINDYHGGNVRMT